MNRRWFVGGRGPILGAGTLALLVLIIGLVPVAVAHDPTVDSYNWTCSGGGATADGNCYQHHSNADETWRWGTAPTSWRNAIRAGQAEWDQTDGHQFNFIETSTGRSVVNATTSIICGNPNAVGCTGMGVQADGHSTGCTITFRIGPAWNLDPNATSFPGLLDLAGVSAHEFGHCVSLGHSASSSATMGGASYTGSTAARTIHYWDQKGRCQVYGHAHGYWGGCGSFGGTS